MSNYRIFYQVALCVVGVILTILGYGAFVNNIWGSVGVALIVCSGLRIFRHIRMSKDPEYKEKVIVAQKDERNIKIAEKSAAVAFRLSLFLLCLVELLLFAFELIEIGTALGLLVCVMLIIYWVLYMINNKNL